MLNTTEFSSWIVKEKCRWRREREICEKRYGINGKNQDESVRKMQKLKKYKGSRSVRRMKKSEEHIAEET
jgi:hypothetical protein